MALQAVYPKRLVSDVDTRTPWKIFPCDRTGDDGMAVKTESGFVALNDDMSTAEGAAPVWANETLAGLSRQRLVETQE